MGLFHELPVRWGAPQGREDDSAWFEEELPALLGDLAVDRPAQDRFDSIVVDEGQDFSASWWPPTLLALKDRDKGGLYVFLDEGQRVFDRLGHCPDRAGALPAGPQHPQYQAHRPGLRFAVPGAAEVRGP